MHQTAILRYQIASAIIKEDIEQLKILTNNKSDHIINLSDDNGYSPLHVCTIIGNMKLVETIISIGANIHQCTNTKDSVLHIAIEESHTELAKMFVKMGVDLNGLNCYSQNPFMIAALMDNVDIMKTMLEVNPNLINSSDFQELTPLHQAAIKGHVSATKFLLESGSNINATSKRNETPLHISIELKHPLLASFLIENGSDVRKKNLFQQTPLMLASLRGLPHLVRVLVDLTPDLVDAFDEDGYTALHYAAMVREVEVVEALLSLDLNARANDGNTPLHLAVEENEAATVALMLRNGVDIQLKNDKKSYAARCCCC